VTGAVRSDPQRRRELAAIHVARKRLGLDEDSYREFLAGLTGKRSAAELDAAERQRVIEAFRSPNGRHFVWHERREHRLIASLWKNLYLLGEVEEPGPRALDNFVQRQAGVAALKWLAPEAAASVVQALKDWLARAGFELPSTTRRRAALTGEAKASPQARGERESVRADVKKLALTRLVKAQWARLEALGALTFKNDYHRRCALDAYFDNGVASCKKGVDHPMATPAELDQCAELLGAWIRSVRQSGPSGDPAPSAGSPVSSRRSPP
jgi:phage gp16-like protein